MITEELTKLQAITLTEEARQKTVDYLTEQFRRFLRPRDKILICLPEDVGYHCELVAQAAEQNGAVPVKLGGDYRWKNILKLAFNTRAIAIAAPPLVLLGLTKLARRSHTPLYFRHFLCVGYASQDWMLDGIRSGLDCMGWGCFDPGGGSAIAGFSCGKSLGVHIREDAFRVEVEDDDGNVLPEGSFGNIILIPKEAPDFRYHTMERGRIETAPCPCGDTSHRITNITPGAEVEEDLWALGAEIVSWSSILDCKIERKEYGIELELLVFLGEKLPKLPTCARQVIRKWNPETDIPNWFYLDYRKNGL